jgi:hypothetical protein
MRLHVFIEDTLYSDAVIHDSLEIRKDISDRMSTARATFKIPSGGDAARYDEAQYDEAGIGTSLARSAGLRRNGHHRRSRSITAISRITRGSWSRP